MPMIPPKNRHSNLQEGEVHRSGVEENRGHIQQHCHLIRVCSVALHKALYQQLRLALIPHVVAVETWKAFCGPRTRRDGNTRNKCLTSRCTRTQQKQDPTNPSIPLSNTRMVPVEPSLLLVVVVLLIHEQIILAANVSPPNITKSRHDPGQSLHIVTKSTTD